MSLGRIVFALAIVVAVFGSVHGYIWARLVRDPAWTGPWGRVLGAALVALAALIPLAFVGMRALPRALNSPLSWVAYVWMGFLLYLFLFTLASDLVRGLAALAGALPADPERRQWLARATGATVAAVAGLVGIGGAANVARGFEVTNVRVPLARLPKAAFGYRIVQMSDVHVGPTIGRAFVEQIVRETNALAPDLVVITGDLVDGSVEQLGDLVEPLRDLRARDGVYFVTGNHEYYSGADAWIAHLATVGVRVLRNERVPIGDAFDLAGVDDHSAGGMLAGHGEDVARAVAGRDPSRAVVLLAHQPKAVHEARRADVDLQLSGHVHGGQLVPFNWLVRLDQPFVAGLHKVGDTWVYVNSGTGYWGPPMRVGTRAELTCLELVTA
jgi:predicted MPP superfamily phosphohydrolase